MLPFSLNCNHFTMESFILELNELFFRTMHSSALRALECIAWGRGSTGDSETGDAETGDIKTSERERETGNEVHI